MPFKASIILVKSHNYIIKYLKISSAAIMSCIPCYFWPCSLYECEVAHVSLPCATCVTIGDLLISQLKIVIIVRKEVPRVVPLLRIRI